MHRQEWANTLRGVAAVAVLFFHFFVVFWTQQEIAASLARHEPLYSGDTGAPSFARVLAAVPIDLGAFGVGLFFLISGYVIAISLDRYGRRGFLVGRCLRVLPTYAAGYLVTCGVIWAVSDPYSELSPGGVAAGIVPGVQFLLGVHAPGDGIVWTLIIELVFYGVCLVAYRRLTRHWTAIALTAVVCVLVQLVVPPPSTLVGSPLGGLAYVVLLSCPFLPVMLIGVALSGHRRGQIAGRATAVLVPCLAVVHVVLMSTTRVVPTTVEYRSTFVIAIAVFALIWSRGTRWRSRALPGFLADISYPLYVVHPVLGYALLARLSARGVPSGLAVLLGAVVAVSAAWVLHRLVEVPTHRLGQRAARALPGGITDVPAAERIESQEPAGLAE